MQTHPRKLVVIITEAALESVLVKDVQRLGAHGYTISDVRGGGRHGAREAAWEADRNIRMEVICDDSTAGAIAEHVRSQYAMNYATTLFVADIGVLRPEKF
ncbi:MAG: transcriptional regulator [Burkholderiales bacterium]